MRSRLQCVSRGLGVGLGGDEGQSEQTVEGEGAGSEGWHADVRHAGEGRPASRGACDVVCFPVGRAGHNLARCCWRNFAVVFSVGA